MKLPNGDYEWHDAAFNTDSSQWQYLSKKIVANSDYTQVAYYLEYYNDVNNAMFDGIQLYKEEFGQSYAYDEDGNVVSASDLAKKNSTFEYNGSNDLVRSADPKGSQFNYEYDSKHNVTKATSAENAVYSFTYDSYGNPLTSKAGDSSLFIKSSASYTTDGNYLDSMTDSSGNTVSNSWNSSKGVLNSFTDAAGKTTFYTYDSNTDNLLSVSKQVDGQTITNSYTSENDKLKAITHNGFSYNFGYDALGNNTTVAVGSQNLITNSFEARSGKLLSSTYGNGQTVSSDYDNLDRVINKKYNGNVRFSYQYDGTGNLGYKSDKVNGVNFRYIYDLADRLVKTVDSLGNTTAFDYESANNSITSVKLWHYYGDSRKYHDVIVQFSNDPTFKAGVTTVYNNDTDNSAGLGAGTDSEYNESSSGKTITVNPAKARYVRFYSNGNGVNGYNHYVEAQVNGASGNMAAGKSITSSNEFNNSSRITDGSTDTNSYSDSSPNTGLQWVQVDLGAPSNLGDNLAKLTETIVGQSNPITTNYEYDKDSKLKKVILNKGSYLTNTYDTIGRLTGKTITDGSANYSTVYSYLAGSGSNGSTTTKVYSITNNGAAISYSYDCNGNISTITQGSQVISYQYNELSEVVRENNQVLNKTVTYAYDAGGNITSKNEYAYTTGTLGTPTKTINYSFGDSNWNDKLMSYDGKSITYDVIGNPLTYDGWRFEWEQGRQLITASGNGHSISYIYDDSGIRTQKVADGVTTNYHLVGDKVTYESNGTDKVYYSYDSSGDLLSMNLNGTEYYYIRNAQGDIIGLFDSAGTQVVSYTYDTWGKMVSTTGSLASTVGVKNPYRYRGYRYDTETQLYYLQSRYYNPDWGRFINADALGGEVGTLLSHNMFAYSLNNPVNMEDSSGHFPTLTQVFNGLKTYAGSALEVIGGASLIVAGIGACATGNVVLGIASIAYGLNHVVTGVADINFKLEGSTNKVGSVNPLKSIMSIALGDNIGSTAYHVGDFAVAGGLYKANKIPNAANLVAKKTMTLVNSKYNLATERYTFTGINGLKNIFSSGWNVSSVGVAKSAKDIGGVISKFVKIF